MQVVCSPQQPRSMWAHLHSSPCSDALSQRVRTDSPHICIPLPHRQLCATFGGCSTFRVLPHQIHASLCARRRSAYGRTEPTAARLHRTASDIDAASTCHSGKQYSGLHSASAQRRSQVSCCYVSGHQVCTGCAFALLFRVHESTPVCGMRAQICTVSGNCPQMPCSSCIDCQVPRHFPDE